MLYAFLVIIALIFIYRVYIKDAPVRPTNPKMNNEEAFVEALFREFGSRNYFSYIFIQRPKNAEEVFRCKQICEKYGYNYYMLFKNIKQLFWNHECYFIGWHATFDKGRLTLVKLKPGESNFKDIEIDKEDGKRKRKRITAS